MQELFQLYSLPTLLVGTAYVVCIVMIHVHVLLMRQRPFGTAAVSSQQLMSVWVVAISPLLWVLLQRPVGRRG